MGQLFLHAGQLDIEGRKMMRFQKFITIQEARKYSADNLEYYSCFYAGEEIGLYTNTVNSAVLYEKLVIEFLAKLGSVLRAQSTGGTFQRGKKWTSEEFNTINMLKP